MHRGFGTLYEETPFLRRTTKLSTCAVVLAKVAPLTCPSGLLGVSSTPFCLSKPLPLVKVGRYYFSEHHRTRIISEYEDPPIGMSGSGNTSAV